MSVVWHLVRVITAATRSSTIIIHKIASFTNSNIKYVNLQKVLIKRTYKKQNLQKDKIL